MALSLSAAKTDCQLLPAELLDAALVDTATQGQSVGERVQRPVLVSLWGYPEPPIPPWGSATGSLGSLSPSSQPRLPAPLGVWPLRGYGTPQQLPDRCRESGVR